MTSSTNIPDVDVLPETYLTLYGQSSFPSSQLPELLHKWLRQLTCLLVLEATGS